MDMKELIIDALKTLDPKNDEHWTNDGQPAVAALGIVDLKRKDITDAAPHFSRENPVTELKTVTEGDENANEENKDKEENSEEGLQEKEVVQDAVLKAQEKVNEANKALSELTAELDVLIAKEEAEKGKRTTQEDIQNFIKAQHKQRVDAAEKKIALEKATAKILAGK